MKLGLFGMPIHPAERNRTAAYASDANRIILADRIGFDEAWVGEHQSCTTEPVANPLILLASVIHRTKNIKLGSGVVALPMHHPATVAAMVAQFDHMAEGRFLFGIGPGGLASDMELYGVLDPQTRTEKMQESIDIILDIWQTEAPYKYKTKHFDFEIQQTVMKEFSVGEIGKPYQLPHPPIASTAMSPNSNSIKTAVMKGWLPMSANFNPLSTVYSHWEKYKEGCEAIGKEPTGHDWRVARNITIADSDAEALDRALDPEGPNHFYFKYLYGLFSGLDLPAHMNDTGIPHDQVTTEDLVKDMVIYGTPDTVAQKLTAIREKAPFGTLLMAMLDGSTEQHEAYEQESMRRLATEVLPNLTRKVVHA